MESLEFNKVAGGVLGTLLFVVGLGIVTEGMFTPEKPAKPGWDLPSAPEGGGAKAEAKTEELPFPTVLAGADPTRGKSDAGVCGTCHNFEKGQGTKIGPDLYGVVGRDKGSVAGFSYSDGMKAKGGTWTFEDLNQFLTKPAAYIQGTKMNYGGEGDIKKRAEIIAYLNKNSDGPLPLPKPEAAPAKAGDAAKPAEAPKAAAAAPAAPPAKPAEAPKSTAAPAAPKAAEAAKPAEAPKPAAPPKAAEAAKPATPAAASGPVKGDPVKGKADAAICGVCHNFPKGAGPKVGPPLYGVVGRARASVPGFNYSAAMKAKGGTWTAEDIGTFITNPQAFVKGTLMGFAGEPDPQKRADIVAYLSTLSDNPPK